MTQNTEPEGNYKSIDFLLNILYDKIYNTESKKCYIVPPIVKSEIDIDTIKRTEPDDTEEVWTTKFKYMGKYNGKWTFKRSSDTSYPCTISIGEYNMNNTNLNDM